MPRQPGKKSRIQKYDRNMRVQVAAGQNLEWFCPDKSPFRLTGFAWYSKEHKYRRLPEKNEDKLPEAVNWLANCTAGGRIDFRSDSKRIAVRVQLTGLADMNHMPATGQCGFDLYYGSGRSMRFATSSKYDIGQTSYEVTLFDGDRSEMRDFSLFFPLYQGVHEISVGLEKGSRILRPRPFAREGRIVFYGTSITQGGCASRPGMAYTNIISRKLNMETVNLGFSGSGKGEPEVARVVARIDKPAIFVIDCDANCPATDVFGGILEEFIRIIRRRHKTTPILVVSRIIFASDLYRKKADLDRISRRDMQSKIVRDFRQNGDSNIFFADGGDLLGDDFDECTVDGVHPTDLGFMKMAEKLATRIRRIILEPVSKSRDAQ